MIIFIIIGIILLLGIYIYSKRQIIIKDIEETLNKYLPKFQNKKIKSKGKTKLKKIDLNNFLDKITYVPFTKIAFALITIGITIVIGSVVISNVKTSMETMPEYNNTAMGSTLSGVLDIMKFMPVVLIFLAGVYMFFIFKRRNNDIF